MWMWSFCGLHGCVNSCGLVGREPKKRFGFKCHSRGSANCHINGGWITFIWCWLTAAFQYRADIINDGGLLFYFERIEVQHSFFANLHTTVHIKTPLPQFTPKIWPCSLMGDGFETLEGDLRLASPHFFMCWAGIYLHSHLQIAKDLIFTILKTHLAL